MTLNDFFGNMTSVSGNINTALSKVGNNNYTEFFQGTSTWAWTSSEYDAPYAILIDSGVNESKGAGSIRFNFNYGTVSNIPIRPFLAF